jgi:hypothetical protein
MVDVLRASSLLLMILMVIIFFTACATREQADSDSMLRKKEPDNEVHGEVGVSYGRSG